MKKTKKTARSLIPPATDHPTVVLNPKELRHRFSLIEHLEPEFPDYDLSVFEEYDADLECLKARLVEITIPKKNHARARVLREAAGELREKIRLLEMVKKTDGKRPDGWITRLNHEVKWAGCYQAELLYRLALDGDAEACQAFSEKAYEYFWRLKRIAIEGPEAHDAPKAFAAALRSLATLAIEATKVVNKYVAENPDIFKPIATEQIYWPFLKSLNKKLNPIRADDEDGILRKLNLGKKTQRKLAPDKRYNPENRAIKVAQKLLDYVRDIRLIGQYVSEIDLSGRLGPVVRTTELLSQAACLPDVKMAPKAAEKWWKLAKHFLLESYPALDPESDAPLEAVAPTLLALSEAGNSQDRKRRILYNIERKFAVVLGVPPKATKATKAPPPPLTTVMEWSAQTKKNHPDLDKRLEIDLKLVRMTK